MDMFMRRRFSTQDKLIGASLLTLLMLGGVMFWFFYGSSMGNTEGNEAVVGIFGGTLPCPDCPGIEMKLVLMGSDEYTGAGRYSLQRVYLDRTPEPFVEVGEWFIERGTESDAEAVVYALYKNGSETATGRYLKVDGNTILQIEEDGDTTPADELYELTDASVDRAIDDSLYASWKWVRTERPDGSVFSPNDPAQFTLTLETDGQMSSGTDCNSLGGSFIVDGEIISFSEFSTTFMFCEGSIEMEYGADLALATSYDITGDTLIIYLNRDVGEMYFERVAE